ncbi:MAG: hypothetical protein R2875_08055 [Desulfobacterales bacterium]
MKIRNGLLPFIRFGQLTGGLVVQQPIENIMQAAKKEANFIIFLIIGCFCIGR